mmetsp:Transcript_62197/g.183924  ORF Transcript_62197/g.183924 Transcript_62197/m.183924 type:complete len:212 (-) Transcript_62197:64-699(-)
MEPARRRVVLLGVDELRGCVFLAHECVQHAVLCFVRGPPAGRKVRSDDRLRAEERRPLGRTVVLSPLSSPLPRDGVRRRRRGGGGGGGAQFPQVRARRRPETPAVPPRPVLERQVDAAALALAFAVEPTFARPADDLSQAQTRTLQRERLVVLATVQRPPVRPLVLPGYVGPPVGTVMLDPRVAKVEDDRLLLVVAPAPKRGECAPPRRRR